MESIARRYTSPARPPRLIVAAGPGATPSAPPPLLCLRCGGGTGHALPGLVTFGWGRVVARR